MSDGIALLNSLLLAVGLAFESFVVALANGLHSPNNSLKRALLYAGLFAVCHAVALAIGYVLIKTVADGIQAIDKYLTGIAAGVLLLLGIKMIVEGIMRLRGKKEKPARTIAESVLQSAVASFDAFASGLTMPDYSVWFVLLTAGMICAVIIPIYAVGFSAGNRFGSKFGKYSSILGGLVFFGLATEVIIGAV